jgi:Fe2+ or Zn2+ uptake regulation protein
MHTATRPAHHPSSLAGALVCTRCGARLPLDALALELARDEVARATGFELTAGSLELSGCCALCRDDRDLPVRWGRA